MKLLDLLAKKLSRRSVAASFGQACSRDAIRLGLVSFSQAAEDLVLFNLLIELKRRPPFHYVDIGCFQPVRYSNTYFFYLLGGSGLVIDLRAAHKAAFEKIRPRDKFVCAAVSDRVEAVPIISEGRAIDRIGEGPNSVAVIPHSLSSLLETHWVKTRPIDILDIDCEGSDLAVLRSNDWRNFRPRTVVVEDFHPRESSETSPVTLFMAEHGYRQMLRLRNNSFFVDDCQRV